MLGRWWFVMTLALAACGPRADALYASCDRDSDCTCRSYPTDDPDESTIRVCLECLTVAHPPLTGRFCSFDCESDLDCDSRIGLSDGACVRAPGERIGICHQRCDDEPCYPTSRCTAIGGELICVPEHR